MKRPAFKVKPRKRRWLRRLMWAAAGLLVLLLAVPFVFTAPLLRWYLAHSAYRDVPVRFGGASLGLTGRVTLHDVTWERDGRPSEAAAGRVACGGWELISGHIKTLEVDDLDVALRPGRERQALRALGLPEDLGGTGATTGTAAPAARGLTCDQIIVNGRVELAGYEPWMTLCQVAADKPLPLHLVLRQESTGPRRTQTVSLYVGEADPKTLPFFSSVFKVERDGSKTQITVDRCTAGNLSPVVTQALLRQWPGVPAALRREARGRLDRLAISGTLKLDEGGPATVSASVELHDLSARSMDEPALALEHGAAGVHVEGKISPDGPWFKDLTFNPMWCTWDVLQAGDWKLSQGNASFQLAGTELIVSDLRAQCADVPVVLTAAVDWPSGLLTRGRLWMQSVSAGFLRQHLPAGLGARIPEGLDGNVAARVFLSESDREHVAAYVEVDCPDVLTFNMTTTGSAPATRSAGGAGEPGMVLTNGMISGTVTWNLQPDSLPEVTYGRLTADQVAVLPPARIGVKAGPPTVLGRVRADFDLAPEMLRLNDLYADLPGNGRLSLEGAYAAPEGSLQDVSLSFSGVDLALANAWLPAGWLVSGQADAEWHGSWSARAAALDGSLGLGSQMTVRGPAGKLTLAGAPAVAGLRLTWDRRTGIAQIQEADLSGVTELQADAPLVGALRKAAGPPAGSAAAILFDRLAGGAYVSFDKIGVTGRGEPGGLAVTVSCSGLDAGTIAQAAEKSPTLLNVSLKVDAAAQLSAAGVPRVATLRLIGGQFLAEKLTLNQNVYAEISGSFSAGDGAAYFTGGALALAEGSVEGDAAVRWDGELENLHVSFTGLHQQALWRNLRPDVFTAEGPISGKLSLARNADGRLAGMMECTSDQPGRLKLSRAAAGSLAAQKIAQPAAGSTAGTIAAEDLADFGYASGRANLQEDAAGGGLRLTLDYQPADGGRWQLRGTTQPLGATLGEMLGKFAGF